MTINRGREKGIRHYTSKRETWGRVSVGAYTQVKFQQTKRRKARGKKGRTHQLLGNLRKRVVRERESRGTSVLILADGECALCKREGKIGRKGRAQVRTQGGLRGRGPRWGNVTSTGLQRKRFQKATGIARPRAHGWSKETG